MAERRQCTGPVAVRRALDAGEPLRLLLVREGELSAATQALVDRCREAGIPIRTAGPREILRMARLEEPAPAGEPTEPELLALTGPDPAAGLDVVMAAGGALWLLSGVAYPGNAGFAIRTAEVSGADGVLLDCPFDRSGRRQALRTAMRADRYLPVHWLEAGDAVAKARQTGRRIVAIEDSGRRAPWDADLAGPVLFVIGGEAGGIDAGLLERCDETLRIPMRGFIPSYNLQAAMAMVAGERLRQLQMSAGPAED